MHNCITTIDGAIKELENLKKILTKKKVSHVNTIEEKNLIKATAYSWINTYQNEFEKINIDIDASTIKTDYCNLLNYSDNRTKRAVYKKLITSLKSKLIKLRTEVVNKTNSGEILSKNPVVMPNFSSFISDPRMINVLKKRWIEIENCLNNHAPLAATVMMGGLLESVLMTRINTLNDKNILFKQKSTPKDNKTNKPKQLSEWMLKDYIDVSSEIELITKPSADFSRSIRDYRNYIHPEKEIRKGEGIEEGDARLFWVVTTNLIEQLLAIH